MNNIHTLQVKVAREHLFSIVRSFETFHAEFLERAAKDPADTIEWWAKEITLRQYKSTQAKMLLQVLEKEDIDVVATIKYVIEKLQKNLLNEPWTQNSTNPYNNARNSVEAKGIVDVINDYDYLLSCVEAVVTTENIRRLREEHPVLLTIANWSEDKLKQCSNKRKPEKLEALRNALASHTLRLLLTGEDIQSDTQAWNLFCTTAECERLMA